MLDRSAVVTAASPVQLEEAKVPVKQLKHNPAKVQPVTPALQALLSKDAELKVGC